MFHIGGNHEETYKTFHCSPKCRRYGDEFSASGRRFYPGEYADTQPGFGGDVTVTLTVDEAAITDVQVVGDAETPDRGGVAMQVLAEEILNAQGAEVDGVTEATITSDAVIKAAANALTLAEGGELAQAALAMEDGTYTATVPSYAEQFGLATTGSMTMSVTIAENKITDIEILESTDTDVIGKTAFPILAEDVIANQSLAVDLVSGATVSSAAFMAGLKDCIAQAGGESSVDAALAVPVEKPEPETITYGTQVLVIGAGMAGLTAAIQAASMGAGVILLEKNKVYSSSTTRSVGYVIGAGTQFQADQGIEDTPEKFAEDLYNLYKDEETLDENLLKDMALHSGEQVTWLAEQGVDFHEVIRKSAKGERSTPRIHTTVGGGSVTSALVSKALDLGVNLLLGTPATDLIQAEDGSIVGAKATNDNGDDIIHLRSLYHRCYRFLHR